MKVFVTGATGYIGFHVAIALRRAGHEVWGLTRTDEKSGVLERQEVQPVLGRLQDLDSWVPSAQQADAVVHAAVDYKADTLTLDANTVDVLLTSSTRGASPRTLLYTSGVWVHGNTGARTVDEREPPTPLPLVARRLETEARVLGAPHVRGVVIRPGVVYGKQGGLTAQWFASAAAGELQMVGNGDNHWAMVHVEDLADAYVRAFELAPAGEVFNVTDGSRSTVREMVTAVARLGNQPVRSIPLAEARAAMGDFADALAVDQRVDSGKAQRLLGWRPRRQGFISGVATYQRAWRA